MFKKVSIQEALNFSQAVFIDVRTPLEFSEGAIPGAKNISLLSNEERIEIGTLYKQQGARIARERGLEMVSPKLPSLYQAIRDVSQGKLPILYCWRGGLRSSTVAATMDLTGLEVSLVEGGYKAYRNEVLRVLNETYPFELVTLYGLTGVGKTILLRKMKERGLPVIDLEALACHRGSVFGQVGIPMVQTQKNFEALLYNEIQKYHPSSIVFIEGESQRIGPIVLPSSWMDQMQKGRKILVKSSLEVRTKRILEEYLHREEKTIFPQLERALLSLQKRLGRELFQKIYILFQQKNYESVVRYLLEKYYDRNYKYSAVTSNEDFLLILENDTMEDEEKATTILDTFF